MFCTKCGITVSEERLEPGKKRNCPICWATITYDTFDYTFHKFIVSGSNKAAYTAALAVAENQAFTTNPLYIYGASNGKTHLLHAIRNHVASQHSTLYISGTSFRNEHINAVCSAKEENFRSKYRAAVDCLLVDDVQSIAESKQAEEEFLLTLLAHQERQTRVVITGRATSKELFHAHPQLCEYLEGGLVVGIEPPGYALRLKVLTQYMRWCHGDNIPMPDEVLELVAREKQSIPGLLKAGRNLNYYVSEIKGGPIEEASELHVFTD